MATWHKISSARSAERLVGLKPSRMAVGHGRVIENPVAEMQMAVDVAKRKLGLD